MVTFHIRYLNFPSNLRRGWVTSCVDISSFALSFTTSLAWGTIYLRLTLSIALSTSCPSSLTKLMTHTYYCFDCFNRWAIYQSNKTLILGINSVELSIKKTLRASFMKCISVIKKITTAVECYKTKSDSKGLLAYWQRGKIWGQSWRSLIQVMTGS